MIKKRSIKVFYPLQKWKSGEKEKMPKIDTYGIIAKLRHKRTKFVIRQLKH